MAAKRKPAASAAKRGRKKAAPQPAIDWRWSILLFGLGLLFVVLSVLAGESAWAWFRQNVLFGVFGISGWLVGPLMLYLAVRVGTEKPVRPVLIRSIFGMVVLSGVALVFSSQDLSGLTFTEVVKELHAEGQLNHFSGGVLSIVLGHLLRATCGVVAARIIMIILVLVAIMVFTAVTPGDAFLFLNEKLGLFQARERERREVYEQEYEEEPSYEQENFYDNPAYQPAQETRKKGKRGKSKSVDIDLGPVGPTSTPGLAPHDKVEIGPGGTFGMDPLKEKKEPSPVIEEPLMPFDPYSTRSLLDGVEQKQKPISLMGESNAAGAAWQGQLFKKDESALDVQPEALPQVPVQTVQPQQAATGQPGDENVEALISKAIATKKEGEATTNTQIQQARAEYRFPPISLFEKGALEDDTGAREEMRKTADLLVSTLDSFGVQTRILDVSRGPSVTRYEIQPQIGVKISRITNLADDIALNLAAAGVRIEAPIPGKPAVGIEVPNRKKSTVAIRSILESPAFQSDKAQLPIALGKDIAGECVVADLSKMPHLLIAGSTGSGKSVCVNATITSFLYRFGPEELKLLLIDPKVVELAEYNGIPHLLMPVITEPRKAAGALGAAVAEMERRYHLFAEHNVRDIKTFNKLSRRSGDLETMPYIAIVIDELADLMMVAGKDVENYICRIAQKARAAGMHLIVATQRPSVDVITGLIKANIPSRIAFAVSSQVDSRTILDGAGAEKLLGMGDMLFMPVGANKPIRVQGTYVKDEEISSVLDFIRAEGPASYDEDMIKAMEKHTATEGGGDGGASDGDSLMDDPVFINAVETALEQGQISTSMLQRKLRVGYARAGRIMDEMQRLHIVSEPDGARPRQVLIGRQQWLEMSMNAADGQQAEY
ncbi:MAG: DNA translocase FtsK 4TM domain-containing protein [Oscillospiraceae bacterium]